MGGLFNERVLGAVVVLILGGCATAPAPAPQPTASIQPTPGAPQTCPLGMAGTEVAVVDEPAGAVDITFTTKGDVFELRRRVRDQAANHGPGSHSGLGHGGVHTGAETHGLRLSQLPPVETEVVEVDGGARLKVTSRDAAERARVHDELHERAARIVALGDCPAGR